MRIDSALRRAAAVNAANLAVTFEGQRCTWADFLPRVQRAAGALEGLGVVPGDRVAILGLNSDTYLELLYAVPWLGAVVVPMNTRLAGPEIAHWLNDSGARVLLLEDEFAEVVEGVRADLQEIERVVGFGLWRRDSHGPSWEELVACAAAIPAHEGSDQDPAMIFYTGGTTGRSKGVTLSHRNVLSSALQTLVALRWGPDSVYLHAAPMFHMADGLGTYAALLAGATQTMTRRFEASTVLDTIEDARVTCSVVVPTMVDLLVRDDSLHARDLSCLESLAFGGSPMPEAIVRRALQAIPGIRLFQLYGQSEAAPTLTVLGPERHVFEGPLAGKIRSAGKASIGCEVAIVDDEDQFAPAGVVGEIVARGDNIMLGYWNQPETSATTLRNGWLHTGDAGYLDDDGFLFVVDRVKDMIVSGGENVYCAEVENALLLHPDVVEAQVIGVPHERWGEAVHAIIRIADGSGPSQAEIIAHCRQQVAGYKCPKTVEIRDEPFPKSGAGKYLKKDLREPYWSGHHRRVQ